jgi:PAS domain S-box-containing protein
LINKTDEHLVKSIITLAKDLELDVVAEGIEDLKQFAFLNKLGCKYLQGFLFSKPVRVKDFEKLLEKKFDFKKKALKELKDNSEDKYICDPQRDCEKIYCNLPLPVVIVDGNFKIAGFNNKFQEIFKWTKVEIYGKSLSRISNGNTSKFLKTALQKENQDFQEIKIPLMRRDGVLLEATVSLDRSDISSENTSHFVCIITNIKKREAAQEPGYEEYLDNLPNSILVTDINGNIEYVNKGLRI